MKVNSLLTPLAAKLLLFGIVGSVVGTLIYQNPARAEFVRADIFAHLGIAKSQAELGNLYMNGEGVSKNELEGSIWYTKAATQGNASAENNLGEAYYSGQGVGKDESKAVELWKTAAGHGNASAQFHLGMAYSDGAGGLKKSKSEALTWWEKGSAQENADCTSALALAYLNGQGIEMNVTLGLNLLKKAADLGDAVAQYNLGQMYHDGKDMKQDYSEALKWFQKAAVQADSIQLAPIPFALANMYYTGHGTEKNIAEALKWYVRSAELGDASAQLQLGFLYAEDPNNTMGGQNVGESIKWLQMAVDQKQLLGGDRAGAKSLLKKLKDAQAKFARDEAKRQANYAKAGVGSGSSKQELIDMINTLVCQMIKATMQGNRNEIDRCGDRIHAINKILEMDFSASEYEVDAIYSGALDHAQGRDDYGTPLCQ